MSTPPGLVGAALVFWGWQTGLLLLAGPMAGLLEASRFVTWRWDLGATDGRRIADLGRLVLVAMGIYLMATRGTAHAVLGLIEWFPLAVLPLVVCQAYGPGVRIDLRTFFLILRRRAGRDDSPVDLAQPFLAVCVAAASAANVRTPGFYAGLCVLTAWALWPVKPAAAPRLAWASLLGLAVIAGYGGQVALHALQGGLERTVADWVFDYTGKSADPYRSQTAMGYLGQLKLSDRIALRVDAGRGLVRPPILLHEAAYNIYAGGVWGAVDADFEAVPPAEDRRTWVLASGMEPSERLTVSAYLTGGRGLVPLPGGASRVEQLVAVGMKRNRLGTVAVEQGPGLITYRVGFRPGQALGTSPSELDLRVPKQDAAVLDRIVAELGLATRSPRESLETVAAYFRSNFRYATFLGGVRPGATVLADFLLRTRAGHCEYFATATVLVLRAAGISARYATGYSVQEWSPREGRYVVRARHAHSWALAYVDGAWRDLDTTPPDWASAEQARASWWEPFADLVSWTVFLVSRWRWSDRDLGLLRYAGWLLLALSGLAAWRLYAWRRVRRAAHVRPSTPRAGHRRGEDSEFYLVEQRLASLGLGRQTWEPVRTWLERVGALHVDGIPTEGLASITALHYRYRFDPDGLSQGEREALRSRARAWLERASGPGPGRGGAGPGQAARS